MMTLYLLLRMGIIIAHDGNVWNNDVEILSSSKLTWGSHAPEDQNARSWRSTSGVVSAELHSSGEALTTRALQGLLSPATSTRSMAFTSEMSGVLVPQASHSCFVFFVLHYMAVAQRLVELQCLGTKQVINP